MPNKISNEELLNDLQRVTGLLGQAPSYEEMRRLGRFSPHTYQRRFGTWTEVKQLVGWTPSWLSYKPEDVSFEDGAWLAGIIDGEGCFRLMRPGPNSNGGKSHSYAPVFTVSIRDDDTPVINEMVRILGVPDTSMHIDSRRACKAHGMKANPAVKINLRDVPTLAFHLIPLLELHPLRGKKRYELPVFAFAVNILLTKRLDGRLNSRYTTEERSLLHHCYLALREMKAYQADYQEILDEHSLPVTLP